MPAVQEDVTKEQVLEKLKRRATGRTSTATSSISGLVSDVFISDAKVYFSITVPAERAQELEPLRAAAERVVKAIPGVKGAMVALTAEKKAAAWKRRYSRPAAPAAPPAAPAAGACACGCARPRARTVTARRGVPGVECDHRRRFRQGRRRQVDDRRQSRAGACRPTVCSVGILDADIYGPSMPRLLGIYGRPQTVDGKILKPMESYGLKVMSMGFLVDEETPMIWRGPMVMSALTQMLREVEWGELDVLVVDMPPGTGDAQLTMAQQVPLAGAVIVSTPQDLALIDARKGLEHVPEGRRAGARHRREHELFPRPRHRRALRIFGHGGARKEAERLGVPSSARCRWRWRSARRSDAGTPVVASEPDGAEARIYRDIAARVWERLREEQGLAAGAAPAIVFE